MNIYIKLNQIIKSSDIELKESVINDILDYIKSGKELFCDKNMDIETFKEPSYAPFCKIVDPRELPPRKDFASKEGLATLIHAITHIEYSAIDLALDAVYRYPYMPIEYKVDWLEVASDEVRHFKMLNNLLMSLDYKYGDFPVHCGLFDASLHTQDNIIDRMAVIPRYYEASGLDVNPQIIKKLANKSKQKNIKELIDILNIIYDEEIVHVQKGDKWFRYLCDIDGYDVEDKYMQILSNYNLIKKHRPHLNIKARKEAGFSCGELLKLGAKDCE
jgi:uncharacterized ferritin-like protein (DUF455 family)